MNIPTCHTLDNLGALFANDILLVFPEPGEPNYITLLGDDVACAWPSLADALDYIAACGEMIVAELPPDVVYIA